MQNGIDSRRKNAPRRATDISTQTKTTPKTGGKTAKCRLAVSKLQGWHGALQQAMRKPRAKQSQVLIANVLADIAAHLPSDGEGTAAHGARPRTHSYVVTMPDGTEQVVVGIQAAAKLYGCKPSSLSVLLSRNGGKVSKAAEWQGMASAISVRRN